MWESDLCTFSLGTVQALKEEQERLAALACAATAVSSVPAVAEQEAAEAKLAWEAERAELLWRLKEQKEHLDEVIPQVRVCPHLLPQPAGHPPLCTSTLVEGSPWSRWYVLV